MTPPQAPRARSEGGRQCTVCGTPMRAPHNVKAGLCHKHNPDRAAARTAQQRGRRHGTTVPPITFTPTQAHWLYDALVELTAAENATRKTANADTVKVLLKALNGLHDEVDWVIDEIRAILKVNPSGTPRRRR